jgi:hypothetical protein
MEDRAKGLPRRAADFPTFVREGRPRQLVREEARMTTGSVLQIQLGCAYPSADLVGPDFSSGAREILRQLGTSSISSVDLRSKGIPTSPLLDLLKPAILLLKPRLRPPGIVYSTFPELMFPRKGLIQLGTECGVPVAVYVSSDGSWVKYQNGTPAVLPKCSVPVSLFPAGG